MVGDDEKFGCESWEEAESTLQKEAVTLALGKGKCEAFEVRYLFAGDLLGQSIASTFGLGTFQGIFSFPIQYSTNYPILQEAPRNFRRVYPRSVLSSQSIPSTTAQSTAAEDATDAM